MSVVVEKGGVPIAAAGIDDDTRLPSDRPVDLERGSVGEQGEAHLRLEQLKKQHGATWESPNDPNDPYNWSSWRKVSIGLIFSIGQLVTLMSASMMAAALNDISADLGIDAETTQITFSTYFLGLACGPFLVAAICEMNGRKNIWVICNAWYILWNSLCPVGNSLALMIAGRFMAALGASAGITLTAPVMADMYPAKDRGKSLAIATFLPYLGPALGPIVGGLVTQLVGWPWLFWVVSIVNAVVTLLGAVFIKESYTPVLLRRKAARLANELNSPGLVMCNWRLWQSILSRLLTNLQRPLQILVRRPVIQVIALVLALNFGIYTFMLSTFAALWIDRYGTSELVSSLHYISISIGSTISAQIGGRVMDWVYRHLRNRSRNRGESGQGKPEFRAPYMVPGVLLIPVGLFWYGWSAEYRVSWVMVDVGAAIFTCGSFMLSQALTAYMLDEFGDHGASAGAASRVTSYILGFAFPIFGPQLYGRFGFGWGNSLLAFVFVVLGLPAPLCFWLWGGKLRALGRRGDRG